MPRADGTYVFKVGDGNFVVKKKGSDLLLLDAGTSKLKAEDTKTVSSPGLVTSRYGLGTDKSEFRQLLKEVKTVHLSRSMSCLPPM